MPASARLGAAFMLLFVAACAAPAPTPTPTPAPTPDVTCPPRIDQPPIATLEDADGNDVEGELGIYNYCGLAGDRPSAGPQHPVRLSSDEINVLVSAPDGPVFVAWQMWSATSIDAPASKMLAQGADPMGLESISVAGPPTGEWSVVAQLTFPGATGQVMYYWRVIAP